jgi:hypothetical protein
VDDVRRFQIEQRDAGVPAPTTNSIVSPLRFLFTHTIDRPDWFCHPSRHLGAAGGTESAFLGLSLDGG